MVPTGVILMVAAGAAFLPLTFVRLVHRFFWLVSAGWPWAVSVRRPGPGWSGRVRGRSGGGLEQVHPLGLPVPFPGQVQGDFAAAVAGGAGGDVDQVAAQRGPSGLGAGEAGQGPGGAQQVVRDGGAGKPGRVGWERAIC